MTVTPAGVVGMKQNIGGMRDAVENLKCVDAPIGCGKQITLEEIADWDPLTQKEYTQSGWCKSCQDNVFGACDDDCGHDESCCAVDVGVGILRCNGIH